MPRPARRRARRSACAGDAVPLARCARTRPATARRRSHVGALGVRAGRLRVLFEVEQLRGDRRPPTRRARRRSAAAASRSSGVPARRESAGATSRLAAVDRHPGGGGGAASARRPTPRTARPSGRRARISSSTPLTNRTRSTLSWLTPMPYGSSVNASPTTSRFGSWAARPTSTVSSPIAASASPCCMATRQSVMSRLARRARTPVVLRLAHLVEVGAALRHAHPGAGGDEVLDAGDAASRFGTSTFWPAS